MDINNNQQINTFIKGMDTDTSDMYMGEGSYRYAENLRVVTDEDSNSGELHIIEGTNKVFDIKPSYEEVEYVDLGLPSGIKWAKCNLGANNPWNGGLYFSWGNVEGHEEGDRYDFSPTTYNNTVGKLLNGNIPANSTYDAAISAKGEGCRIPTTAEFTELIENTTHEWVISYQNSGTNGMLFTASNGNSIFLPAVGYRLGTGNAIERTTSGSYWASSYDSSEDRGFKLNISLSGVSCNSTGRYYGQTIRPVYDRQAGNEILLGYTTIRNYIITVVYRASIIHSRPVGEWAIFRYDSDDNFNKVMVAGWFTEKIWPDDWDQNHNTKPLSLVTRWESNDNIKLYIATGRTELLSINVAPEYEYQSNETFEEVFGITKINLPPITAAVSTRMGAKIPGVTLQYGYVLYKVNGPASTLSMLSNVVTEQVDHTHGYKSSEEGQHPIDLTMPQNVLNKYIRVYRVAYSKAGQLPKVDVIYDQKCTTVNIVDFGQSLYNLSSSEFVATNALLFVPNEIESKGDYLFAGNIKYSQDEIDKQFEKFDARCYSSGSYYKKDGLDYPIGNNASDELLLSLDKNIDLHHVQFDSNTYKFDEDEWEENSDGYSGHGLCFDWKYVYDEKDLYFTDQYHKDTNDVYITPPRTYARNEVYRFGVRLFDSEGNRSSVKWIADIKMPDYFGYNVNTPTRDYLYGYNTAFDNEHRIKTRSVSIEFVPRNTDAEYWNGVAMYEIVLAKRSIDDSFKITLGIVGYPIAMDGGERCLPYFLTLQPFTILSGIMNSVGAYVATHGSGTYTQDKKHVIFCSPEYVYLPDDILQLLKNTKVRYQEISHIIRYADEYTLTVGGVSSSSLGYKLLSHFANPSLTQMPIDLRVQSYIDGTSSELSYILTPAVMTDHNNNNRSGISYGPINGNHGKDARKNVFFTNMYAQAHPIPGNNDLSIYGITFNDAQENNLAKNEYPTYRNLFKTLPNGDKFFNWTNPALMRKLMYEYLTGSEDNLNDGWKDCTMSSREEGFIDKKYSYSVLIGSAYSDDRVLTASSALMFPTSTGGPNIVLEFENNVSSNFLDYQPTLVNSSSEGLYFHAPVITVANIYKNATPYGGYNITSINNTQYISQGVCGYPSDESLVVSMGDNVISMFIYCLYHSIDDAVHDDIVTGAIQYIVPIESTIDITKQCSDYLLAISPTSSEIHNIGNDGRIAGKGVWVQAKPSTVAGRFTQTTDMYMYNTAYSINPDVITYSGQDTVNEANPWYDSRIHYSQKKQNNELIDNWTNFKAIDYLDVDSRYGQITGLKLFKDKLIFLQENGAGVLSVNDRIILKDQESANIIVGNGGVLDRYDYFTTIYGMKPDQHVVEASNDALYWWDGYRKEIIAYADGYNVNLLQRIKNVANYINKGTESATPSIVYDANNKEVLFNVVNDKCITYNEQIQQFTSVYTFNPIYYSNIDGKIYLTDQWVDREHLYEYNQYNEHDTDGPKLFEEERHPKLKYIVNKDSIYNKTFDMLTFGGRFYGGSAVQTLDDTDKHLVKGEHNNNPLTALTFTYNTPTKQQSTANGSQVTNREYDYRLTIPRNHNDIWGGRMRGKTMECTLESNSNNSDFSIQYVVTKYRMSWS